MEAVNRRFRDLVRNLPALQHRSELFAVGLLDNPHCPCDFSGRRKLCSRYTRQWTSAKSMIKTTRSFHAAQPLSWMKYSGNGLLASNLSSNKGLVSLYVPPVTSRKPPETWGIPRFPFWAVGYAAYTPENVAAVAELDENSLRVHILSIRDGSPCGMPPSGIIMWEAPAWSDIQVLESIGITSSRIMTYLHYWRGGVAGSDMCRTIVWDWKMGNMVLDVQSTDWSEFTTGLTAQVIFLDEFRIAVLPGMCPSGELVVFDTLVPQHDSGNVQK